MDYEEALQEALTAINAQSAQQEMAANIEAGNAAYGELKDTAETNRSIEKQRLAQRMADLGLGGTAQPLSVSNNYMMAGRSDIGDISAQNQNYTDVQNAMIKQADANAAAQAAQVTAAMNAAEDASELDEQMNKFDRYYRMYMAKKITASQFKKVTGMDVRGWARKRREQPKWTDEVVMPQLKNAADHAWFNDTVSYINNYANTNVKNGRMSKQAAAKWAINYFKNSAKVYGIK